ncbi:MAG: Ig-like domain-containing protein [Lewinellaceae bacterium]|nr:Ig-like domain-containing protein [Lewinellaceae bacterium]
MRYYIPGLGLLLLWLAASCASPVAPVGGPRDETPPRIDSSASTANLQTNFQKQTITLTFDEWITLEDVFNQVVISPPLQYRPEIKLRRRSVVVQFDEREELRENVTYTINFGQAVKDLNEKNPAEDLRFVFSTGPYLDSLSISGQVIDVATGKPAEKIRVMLYDNPADSVVRKDRPLYLAITDKGGNFSIKNLREGRFKIFALDDINFNYRYDLPNERIAFIDTLLAIEPDKELQPVLQLFTTLPPLRLVETEQKAYGLIKLTFNQPPDSVRLAVDPAPPAWAHEQKGDTLLVWYNDTASIPAWKIYPSLDTVTLDTIGVRYYPQATFLEEAELQLVQGPRPGQPTSINPDRPLRFVFNHPVTAIDTSLIRLLADSIMTPVPVTFIPDSALTRAIFLNHAWQPGIPYQLNILPGAIRDLYGLTTDSLTLNLRPALRNTFGNVQFSFNNLDSAKAYVIEVLDPNQAKIITYRYHLVGSASAEIKALSPGKYTLRITEDRNGNGRWDSGNYDLLQQPERLATYSLEELRANWDLEAEIDIGALFKGGPVVPSEPVPPAGQRPNRN